MLCICGHSDEDHVVHNDVSWMEHDSAQRCSCFRPCFKCRCMGFEKKAKTEQPIEATK